MQSLLINEEVLDIIQSIRDDTNGESYPFFLTKRPLLNIDLFLFFTVYGFKRNIKSELTGSNKRSIPKSRFEKKFEFNGILIHAIAYHDTSDPAMLVDLEQAMVIANQYALGGAHDFLKLPDREKEQIVTRHLGKLF